MGLNYKLTDKQKEFAAENIKLVYSYACKRHLRPDENEDLMGDLFEEYCKAICQYDESKGKFSTFLYKVLDTKRMKVYTYTRCKCRYAEQEPLSIDVPYYISKNGKAYNETEIEYTEDTFDDIEWNDFVKGVIKALDERQAQVANGLGKARNRLRKVDDSTVVKLLANGWSRRDICRKYNISSQAVQQKIQRTIKPIWDEHMKEMEECV